MFETFFKENYIDFNKLLINHFPQLGLDEKSVIVLIILFEMKQQNNNLLIMKKIKEKTTMSMSEIGDILQFLINKDFVSLDTLDTNGITKEIFSIEPTFAKLSRLFTNNQFDIDDSLKDKEIQEAVAIIEAELGTALSNIQIQNIQSWIEEDQYSLDLIKKALKEAAKVSKVNIRYMDSILKRLSKDQEQPSVKRDTKIAELFENWMKENE